MLQDQARGLGRRHMRGVRSDRAFGALALAGGSVVLVVLGLIAVSTTQQAWPWFRDQGLGGILSTTWDPTTGHFGVLALMYGTVLVAVIALVMAVPVSIGIALFVNEVVSRRFRSGIVSTIDLLAAVPSVVFGLWGLFVIVRPLASAFRWLSDALHGVPLLGALTSDPSSSGQSFVTAGIIVALMITPIVTSLTREVFATTPVAQKEAALALGATRWEMIRGSIFPHSYSGIVAAVILGFGRAVGETIAVALLIGASTPALTEKIFGPGNAMAAIVANQFGEASGTHRAALIGLGVVLLVMTFVLGAGVRVLLVRAERERSA